MAYLEWSHLLFLMVRWLSFGFGGLTNARLDTLITCAYITPGTHLRQLCFDTGCFFVLRFYLAAQYIRSGIEEAGSMTGALYV